MPTYNRANYIADAAQSVLNQTYMDIELIIIDDGSTDNTEEVITPFLKDNRTRYIKQKNLGAATARNHGLAIRTGKYVAFIDSDDIWEKDKIDIQLSVLNALAEVHIVFSDFSSVDEIGHTEESHIKSYFSVCDDYKLNYEDIFDNITTENIRGLKDKHKVYWGNIYDTMIFGNLILTSTFFCRQEVFERAGNFNTKYETLEDYDLFLRVTKKNPVAFVDKPLVRYRYNQNQLSGDAFYGQLCTNLIDIFSRNIEDIEDNDFIAKNKKKIKKHLGLIQARHAYYHFSKENLNLASSCYWQSILNNPVSYKSYLYLLFSLLPKSATRFVRKLKTLKGVRS